jgi:hypothetical protein
MENIVYYALVLLYLLSATVSVAQVGKPRVPVTPGVAAAMVVVSAMLIAAVTYLHNA